MSNLVSEIPNNFIFGMLYQSKSGNKLPYIRDKSLIEGEGLEVLSVLNNRIVNTFLLFVLENGIYSVRCKCSKILNGLAFQVHKVFLRQWWK